MMTIQNVLHWFTTTEGCLAVATAIFAMLWVTKNIPVVSRWLADDRRKVIANIILALAPAAAALLDQAATPREAWIAALKIALSAAGLQGMLTGLLGERISQRLRLSGGEGT